MKNLNLDALINAHVEVTKIAAERASQENLAEKKAARFDKAIAAHTSLQYIADVGIDKNLHKRLFKIAADPSVVSYKVLSELLKIAKRYGAVSHHNADALFDCLTSKTAYVDENTSLSDVYTFLPYAGGALDKQPDSEITVRANVDKRVLKRLRSNTLPKQVVYETLISAVYLQQQKMQLEYLTICPECGHDCSADVNKASRWEDYKASTKDAYFKEDSVSDRGLGFEEESEDFEDEFIDTVYSYVDSAKLPNKISSEAYNKLDDVTASYYCPICLTKIVK